MKTPESLSRQISKYGFYFLSVVLLASLWHLAAPMYFAVKGPLADALFFDYFSKDLWSGSFDFGSWVMPPAPSYFPDLLIFSSVYSFYDSPISRLFAFTLVQASMFLSLGFYLIWHFTRDRSYSIVTACAFMGLLLYTCYTTPIWMFMYHGNYHLCTYLNTLLLLAIYLPNHHKSVFGMILFAFVSVLGIVSSKLFILSILLPIGLWEFFSLFIGEGWRQEFFKRSKTALVVAGSTLVGLVLENLIHLDTNLKGRLDGQRKMQLHAIRTLKKTFNEYIEGFGFEYFGITLFVLLGVAALVASIGSKRLRSKTGERFYFLVFAATFSMLTILPAAIYLGVFKDASLRYVYSSFSMFIVAGLIFLHQQIHSKPRVRKILLTAMTSGLVLGSILVSVNFDDFKHQGISKNEAKLALESPLGKRRTCLLKVGRKYDLKAGVSGFFSSSVLNIFLDTVRLNQFTLRSGDLLPHHYLNSIHWYKEVSLEDYNFILTDRKSKFYGFTEPRIVEYFGEPKDVIGCKGVDSKVYVYEDGQLGKIVGRAIERFEKQ